MTAKDEIFSKIISANVRRENLSLSEYACKSASGLRKEPEREKVPDSKNIRPAFSHDTDKIIHSHAYSRYIDKTQVFYLFENDHITHRVLHVQLVSKIARVIGRCLRLNEDLIEAISLAHDIGHAPYGHDGEKILNEICKDPKNKIGYFYHNAQSVRLLTEIEQDGKGLNLSLQVLDGILAHDGEILNRKYKPDYNKTLGTFEDEYRKCFKEENYSKQIFPMTLEGCVVRISDIIAYIGRDIDDAKELKVITNNAVPKEITKILGASNDKIIDTLVQDLIVNSYDKDYLEFSDNISKALSKLLIFNRETIYSNPRTNTEGHKIENMLRQLFEQYYSDILQNNTGSKINNSLRDMDDSYIKNTDKKRIVVDFLAGMTDGFLNNQFKQLFLPQSYGDYLKR
ncbi:Deoxyguanosinetriphosphate triphosphohydrolase-like protein [subsurface metagenome]